MKNKKESVALIPMRSVGPIKIVGPEVDDEVSVPLATFESPLWPSVARGARISRICGGIVSVVLDERMSRSILLEAPGVLAAAEAVRILTAAKQELATVTEGTSRFARLLDMRFQVVGNMIYMRLEFDTGAAAGHNMVTKAADAIMNWILGTCPELRYGSISGNYCTDKKVSAVNGILGRGKYVVAEIVVPGEICAKYLHSSARAIVDLNVRKNLIGGVLAGSLRSANAHYANMLLAFYLATGQDAANIVEGSQGITHAEIRSDGLYFSVTLPNLIVGTVGNGKGLEFVERNLEALGCREEGVPGTSARRLAVIVAATVLCGELSLMAAQTNPGELMKVHQKLERH